MHLTDTLAYEEHWPHGLYDTVGRLNIYTIYKVFGREVKSNLGRAGDNLYTLVSLTTARSRGKINKV